MLDSLANLLGFQSLSIASKHRTTMNSDTLLGLLNSDLSFDTDTLLRDLILFSTVSSDRKTVLDRFMVKSVTLCKDSPTSASIPQHEYLLVQLIDTLPSQSDAKPLLMALERTASDIRPSSEYFTDHPKSKTVIKSIVEILKETPPAIIESLLKLTTNDSSASPALDTHHPYQAIVDDSQSTTSSPNTPFYGLKLLDAASLATAKAAHFFTHSSSKVYRADDRFVGMKNLIGLGATSTLNIRQIQPLSLSLFDLAVLADSVHNHDPLYSIFGSHCYWFANIICNVIEKEYKCQTVTSPEYAFTKDTICFPPNDYLPELAGRWMGVLISRVQETFSSVVASAFKIHLQEKQDLVSFLFISKDAC